MKVEKNSNFQEWVFKILRPLEYVSKNNFANLSKTKGLERALKNLINNAPEEINHIKEKLLEICEGLEISPFEEKRIKILRLLNFLKSFNSSNKEKDTQKEDISEEFSFKDWKFSTEEVSLETYLRYKEILKQPVQFLKGIGPSIAKKLTKKDIHTLEDLLYFLPKDYEDRRKITPIGDLREGQRAVVFGEILKSGTSHFYKRKIFYAYITDGTGFLTLKWFNFNEKVWRRLLAPGKNIYAIGEISRFGKDLEIIHPELIEEGDEEKLSIEIGHIVPVYSSIEGVSEKYFRRIIKIAVEDYGDYLNSCIPAEILKRRKLLPLNVAIKNLHFPEPSEDILLLKRGESIYHKSVSFDEFFFLELALGLRKGRIKKETGISFNTESKLVEDFIKKLPFELTSAQKRVIEEIKRDMASNFPMNRLLQGDVGCGKTVVAFIAALIAIENGYQVALMAPTEILAEQHYYNFRQYAQIMGIHTALLTGGIPPAKKREIYHGLSTGFINFVIGTHALFQEKVDFKRLGLVIIDEQHRFGVLQRAALRDKAKGVIPDTLVMTATPIPRTLALTIYGDLDLSIINEMPKGRKPIITKLFLEYNRRKAYEETRKELKKGHQAYVILPLIEESEKTDLKAVLTHGEYLQKEVFPEYKVGILHGKMSSYEKEKIMHAFKRKEIDILVATTVVEVGVDVPNATVMVIEHAERFGLSQLHQLRGRVGRSEYQSYCFLIAYKVSMENEAFRRLQVLCETNDGFRIAEEDLKLRGPGEFLGTKQSGYLEFRRADIIKDYEILLWAREDAFKLIERDPELKNYPILKEELMRRWEERLKLSEVA
ncbi:MAG: DNA helicase RecG [Thermodesulfobacterium geofontis]|uniref:ATP-dependent DNA helicase RecG n=3 Tax=Thermodesulfobacterium geofontis TaxID=1295609 RepID=A0A2N7PNU9_9BACT|nr:MAG: DNA helicase RecG [Thermodesulfobacterium geofontis]